MENKDKNKLEKKLSRFFNQDVLAGILSILAVGVFAIWGVSSPDATERFKNKLKGILFYKTEKNSSHYNLNAKFEDNHARRGIVKKYKARKQAFPSKLYQQVAGEDGVIDSLEFKNFYEKVDNIARTNYPRLSEFYNKRE